MEKYIKKYIRLRKSLNDKVNIIHQELFNSYSHTTLEYLLQLGILSYEEMKINKQKYNELFLLVDELKQILKMNCK